MTNSQSDNGPGQTRSAERNDTAIDKPWHSAGETVEVVASVATAGQQVQLRRVTVNAGGVLAAHSPGEPAVIVQVLSGSILEFRDDHDVALTHTAPVVVIPGPGHWWRNPGPEPVEMLITDLVAAPSSTPDI